MSQRGLAVLDFFARSNQVGETNPTEICPVVGEQERSEIREGETSLVPGFLEIQKEDINFPKTLFPTTQGSR